MACQTATARQLQVQVRGRGSSAVAAPPRPHTLAAGMREKCATGRSTGTANMRASREMCEWLSLQAAPSSRCCDELPWSLRTP